MPVSVAVKKSACLDEAHNSLGGWRCLSPASLFSFPARTHYHYLRSNPLSLLPPTLVMSPHAAAIQQPELFRAVPVERMPGTIQFSWN